MLPNTHDLTRPAALNGQHRRTASQLVLWSVLTEAQFGRAALVSSFGADSVVLLHMVAQIAPDTPVLFLDTEMLFPETLDYQARVAKALTLSDIRVLRPDPSPALADGLLHERDPDACCDLRKTQPLAKALAGFDTWLTGRKRFQGSSRASLETFEADGPHRLKVNPLAHWSAKDLAAYMDDYDLPRHPLVAKGYPSIGCAPCTTPSDSHEHARAGRWRGQTKTECGIHFNNGTAERSALPKGAPT